MIRKLFGKLVTFVLLVFVVGLASLGGYFYYKAGQPMQVEEAQRLAPGITYREFWADRVQHWKEIDDEKVAQGKGRACVLSGHIMAITWIYPGSIINVSRVHNYPNTMLARKIISDVQGIMPLILTGLSSAILLYQTHINRRTGIVLPIPRVIRSIIQIQVVRHELTQTVLTSTSVHFHHN